MFLVLALLTGVAHSTITAVHQLTFPNQPNTIIYGTHAVFGPWPLMAPSSSAPSSSPLLTYHAATSNYCQPPPSTDADADLASAILFVPRGNCSFATKVLNAQRANAQAVIIYNTIESMYNRPNTTYPIDKLDYECSNGEAYVDEANLERRFVGEESACVTSVSPTQCGSRKCVLTGEKLGELSKVCCAWDLNQVMYGNPFAEHGEEVTIPSAFITLRQFEEVAAMESGSLSMRLENRYRPEINLSSFLIWLLGVAVACGAAFISGSELLSGVRELERRRNGTWVLIGEDPRRGRGKGGKLRREDGIAAGESLELTPKHAILFLCMSSIVLFTLFFVKAYSFVTVMYAFGCSNATAQLIFIPLYTRLLNGNNNNNNSNGQEDTYWDEILCTLPMDIGPCSRLEAIGFLTSYAVGGVWLIIALGDDAANYTVYWIVQDVFGASMCVLFLSVVKLPSVRVAGYLLIAAFFYDIFFVFVTPYIFSKSIMIDVATGGGGPTLDELTCEKYPDTDGCKGGNALPMLFALPRIGDYQGGMSLLGLGDIVLPGLLLSFAFRLDLSKIFVGLTADVASDDEKGETEDTTRGARKNTNICVCGGKGYFLFVCIGYAVGLMCANIAVYWMQMGQPALLYLVPCTLGVMMVLGKRRNEWAEIWRGPKVIDMADKMLFEEEEEDEEEGGEGGGKMGGVDDGHTQVEMASISVEDEFV